MTYSTYIADQSTVSTCNRVRLRSAGASHPGPRATAGVGNTSAKMLVFHDYLFFFDISYLVVLLFAGSGSPIDDALQNG